VYFDSSLTLGDWLPALQQLAFCAALLWFGMVVARSLKTVFRREVTADEESKKAWILVLWFVVPLTVYLVAGLWTYLSYYVILYPVYFLVFGALGQRAVPAKVLIAGVAMFVIGNVIFMLDVNRYLGRYGGAQGTYGSGLGFKEQAAAYLLERGTVDELLDHGRIVQMDRLGEARPAELEFGFLAALHPAVNPAPSSPKRFVLLADMNRTSYRTLTLAQVAQMARMDGIASTNFGPVTIYEMERN
jgi:hypothetical protein